jgi:serine/threonine protein kinase
MSRRVRAGRSVADLDLDLDLGGGEPPMHATVNQVRIMGEAYEPDARPGGTGATVVVAGRYEVELDQPLGSGGMAIVYRGRDLRTRRRVALKTLRLEYRGSPETRARFRHEIRRMAFLDHPNIARVFDLYEEAETEWAVMEYVPGRPLKEQIAERGAIAPEDAADLLDQVAAALAHIHGHGLVHLDVKPQNLLVTPEGVVKLIDFGLTQPAGASQELIGGTTFGTAAYLAPEQAAGETVEPATDVYALGCVVYEMLTGRPPFLGEAGQEVKHEVIRAHLETPPVAPSRLRPDLSLTGAIDDVVLWALAKRPGDRFGDVRQFAALFRSAVDVNASASRETMPLGLEEVPWGAERQAPPSRSTRNALPPRQTVVVARGHVQARPALSSRVYRLGGRAARRSRWLRGVLWRLTGIVAAMNLILALAIVATDGVDGLTPSASNRLRPGGRAEVIVDDLSLRSKPGESNPVIGLLVAGDGLEITGEAEEAEGRVWWPVTVVGRGDEVAGYVWAGGIAPTDAAGLLERLSDRFADLN